MALDLVAKLQQARENLEKMRINEPEKYAEFDAYIDSIIAAEEDSNE